MKLREGMTVISNTDEGSLISGKRYTVFKDEIHSFFITTTNLKVPKMDMHHMVYDANILLAGGLLTIVKRKVKIKLP